MIKATKKLLSFVFGMKEMREARYLLGVKIVINHPKKLLCLCRKAYIKKVLEYSGFTIPNPWILHLRMV